MIELVLTVCMLASPTDCRKERMPFDGGLMACASAGQIVAADWLKTHPKWALSRWSCGPVREDA